MSTPIRNTSQLVAHLHMQYPEVGRPRLRAIVRLAFAAVARSLEAQAAAGEPVPRVRLQGVGTLALRRSLTRVGTDFTTGERKPVAPHFTYRWSPSARVRARLQAQLRAAPVHEETAA